MPKEGTDQEWITSWEEHRNRMGVKKGRIRRLSTSNKRKKELESNKDIKESKLKSGKSL